VMGRASGPSTRRLVPPLRCADCLAPARFAVNLFVYRRAREAGTARSPPTGARRRPRPSAHRIAAHPRHARPRYTEREGGPGASQSGQRPTASDRTEMRSAMNPERHAQSLRDAVLVYGAGIQQRLPRVARASKSLEGKRSECVFLSRLPSAPTPVGPQMLPNTDVRSHHSSVASLFCLTLELQRLCGIPPRSPVPIQRSLAAPR
jgi:hypothetical protein